MRATATQNQSLRLKQATAKVNETLLKLGSIAAGGALGAVARHTIGLACTAFFGTRFGYGTLVVNVLGCFAIGLLMHESWTPPPGRAALAHSGITVGLLGGLTTFSTFGYQTVRHLEAGEPGLALTNVALNLVLGLAAAAAGLWVARSMIVA